MGPLVGVTTTLVPESGTWRRPEIALYAVYVAALEQLGLTSVLITPAHSPRSVKALIEQCHGLVLTGGEDVDPSRYGEDPLPELGMVNPARDEMEMTALGLALEHRIPVLGICRGCQVLNVYFGGTLYQDLDTQRPGELRHRQSEPWGLRTHHVTVEPDSRLSRLLELEEMLINSYHHQAIKDVAPGLVVVAKAADGLIEAVESTSGEWIIGVQWHPERHEATAPETDPDRMLFEGFRMAVVERLESVES